MLQWPRSVCLPKLDCYRHCSRSVKFHCVLVAYMAKPLKGPGRLKSHQKIQQDPFKRFLAQDSTYHWTNWYQQCQVTLHSLWQTHVKAIPCCYNICQPLFLAQLCSYSKGDFGWRDNSCKAIIWAVRPYTRSNHQALSCTQRILPSTSFVKKWERANKHCPFAESTHTFRTESQTPHPQTTRSCPNNAHPRNKTVAQQNRLISMAVRTKNGKWNIQSSTVIEGISSTNWDVCIKQSCFQPSALLSIWCPNLHFRSTHASGSNNRQMVWSIKSWSVSGA
jgi:hypothetical protein